jgi:hypothetical protein
LVQHHCRQRSAQQLRYAPYQGRDRDELGAGVHFQACGAVVGELLPVQRRQRRLSLIFFLPLIRSPMIM